MPSAPPATGPSFQATLYIGDALYQGPSRGPAPPVDFHAVPRPIKRQAQLGSIANGGADPAKTQPCEDFETACNLPLAAQRGVGHTDPRWRRGRVAEGGGLLNRYRVVKPYRGFESLRLRQPPVGAASSPLPLIIRIKAEPFTHLPDRNGPWPP